MARAALWSGSAASHIDLHPSGVWVNSFAYATDGTMQGGAAYSSTTGYEALLWNGSAQSVINLTPAIEVMGQVAAMAPGQQVGYWQQVGSNMRAAMWSGTAESLVDMNPPGAGLSRLYATSGSAQVGYANHSAYGSTAGIWFGTPESFVPLAPFMPPGYTQSVATGVSEHNGLFYVTGHASGPAGQHAFLSIGIPAPGTSGMLAIAGIFAARRRRR